MHQLRAQAVVGIAGLLNLARDALVLALLLHELLGDGIYLLADLFVHGHHAAEFGLVFLEFEVLLVVARHERLARRLAQLVVLRAQLLQGRLVGVGQRLHHAPRLLDVLAHLGHLLTHPAELASRHLRHVIYPLAGAVYLLGETLQAILRMVETGVEVLLVKAEPYEYVAYIVCHNAISCC